MMSDDRGRESKEKATNQGMPRVSNNLQKEGRGKEGRGKEGRGKEGFLLRAFQAAQP